MYGLKKKKIEIFPLLVVIVIVDLHMETLLRVSDQPADLLLIDEPVPVGVGFLHPLASLPPREPRVQAVQRLLQLLPADPPVAVRVELLQPRFELFDAHLSLRKRPVTHEGHGLT